VFLHILTAIESVPRLLISNRAKPPDPKAKLRTP
jgi:hypothetical protein